MKRSVFRLFFIFSFGLAITGCESLQGAGVTENTDSNSDTTQTDQESSSDDQGGNDGANSTAPAAPDSNDSDTATENANGEAGDESGDESGEDSGSNGSDWGDGDEDWGDNDDPWDGDMDGSSGECFHACEMALEENLYECDPDGDWHNGDWEGEGEPPPPEDPQPEPQEPEDSEDSPDDAPDGWGGGDECTEQAFQEFNGCIEACGGDDGWGGPHPGPMNCAERCDYFAEDIMWMCMDTVGNEQECGELSEHAHLICIDECDENGGPGDPGEDCPDYSPQDCGEDEHVEWYEDEMGCSHPECIPNDNGGNGMAGVFECGQEACMMWQDYCQVTYPGQPQGEVQHQCISLPQDCDVEEGYCSCFEAVNAGAGTCEEGSGVVYVTIYAP